MLKYIIKRIVMMIPTVLIISILTFIVIQLPPGDYLTKIVSQLEEQGQTLELAELEALKSRYGLDQPLYVQYWRWLWPILSRGDFGRSFSYNVPVADMIWSRMGYTVLLSFATLLFTWIVSLPIGIYSAIKQYSIGDYVLTGGEIPAMTLIDALSRLVPGVVGKELSVTDDSFYNGMLDTPHYTRPAAWHGQEVPEVLVSGDDARIEKYRKRTAAFLTLSRRPDLLSRANVMDYLEDETYVGLVVPVPADAAEMRQIAQSAGAYGVTRVIAAPERREDFDALRNALASVPEVKCVPSVRRMTEWAERKKHAPLLVIAAEAQPGIPWLEAKRRLVETSGPTLILFGAHPQGENVIAMRPTQTTGGELPRTALVAATLDRFFGSR